MVAALSKGLLYCDNTPGRFSKLGTVGLQELSARIIAPYQFD